MSRVGLALLAIGCGGATGTPSAPGVAPAASATVSREASAAPSAPARVQAAPARVPADAPPRVAAWAASLAAETAQAAFVQGRPPGDPRVDVAALMTDAGCPGVEPAWQGGAEVWTCVVGGRSLVVQHRGDEPDWLAVWTRGAQP